jgi:hypothetical protein
MGDCLTSSDRCVTTTATNVDHCWLNNTQNLVEALLENLLSAHFANVSFCQKEFLKVNKAFVVLGNRLAQKGRWHIVRVVLRYCNHALLANVFGTVEQEDAGGVHSILDKETGLVLVFGEVLDENARCDFKSELLN